MKNWILFIVLAFFVVSSCADNSGDGSSGDSTGDTVTVVIPSDDEPGTTEDQTSDTIEVPANELLSKINLTGSTLALKPRDQEFSLLNGLYNMLIRPAYASVECNELGVLDGDQYEDLIVEGSTPCFSEPEIWDVVDDVPLIYTKYHFKDVEQSPAMASIGLGVEMSIITDNEGNVHHLPGHPIKKDSFKNSKIIYSHNGNPVYINSSNKLVTFDMSSDSESIIINDHVSNFKFKNFTDGDHIFIDTTNDVKQIKPDNSEVVLNEITEGEWYHIGDTIEYLSAGKFKRMTFDLNGDIIDRNCGDIMNCTSVPEWMDLFINDYTAYLNLGIGAGQPLPPLYSSVSGCSESLVTDKKIHICNGRAYRINGVDKNIGEVDWCDYGHCGISTWLTIKSCSTNNFMYFYAQDTLSRNRLTWINDTTKEFRDILDTHQISDLECINDSEVAVIGIKGDLKETLRITNADSISPVITVIDSDIIDIITP